MSDATLQRIRALVAEHFSREPATITETTTFDDLEGDSLDRVELLMDCEDAFDVEIGDDDFESVRSVGDAAALLDRLTGLRAG